MKLLSKVYKKIVLVYHFSVQYAVTSAYTMQNILRTIIRTILDIYKYSNIPIPKYSYIILKKQKPCQAFVKGDFYAI